MQIKIAHSQHTLEYTGQEVEERKLVVLVLSLHNVLKICFGIGDSSCGGALPLNVPRNIVIDFMIL